MLASYVVTKSAGTNTPNPAGRVLAGEEGCTVVFWVAMGRNRS